MTMRRIAVIGAGGHGAVVASTLIAAGIAVAAFFDDQFCGTPGGFQDLNHFLGLLQRHERVGIAMYQ